MLCTLTCCHAQFGKVVTSDSDGADTGERNPYFSAVYDAVEASIRGNKAAKGALFWEWTVRGSGEMLDVSMPNGLHPYGLTVADTTFMCAPFSSVLTPLSIVLHASMPNVPRRGLTSADDSFMRTP